MKEKIMLSMTAIESALKEVRTKNLGSYWVLRAYGNMRMFPHSI
ncbi:hypothetical protein CCP3SC15_1470006 [Gammaproteobacteria bacterium]